MIKKSKKALSNVIVTVLLILIAIVAIITLWVVLKSLLTEKSQETSKYKLLQEGIIVNTKQTNFLSEPVKISVTRTSGELDYESIKIIFYNLTSSYTHIITTNLPNPLETKVYYIYLIYNNETDHTIVNRLVNATHFDIYLVYKSGSHEENFQLIKDYNKPGIYCQQLSDIFLSLEEWNYGQYGKNDVEWNKNKYSYECGYKKADGTPAPALVMYLPAADINDDRNITELDKQSFNEHNGDESWCQERLTKSNNPCDIYICPALLEKLAYSYNSTCVESRYNPIADTDKDSDVDLADLGNIANIMDQPPKCILYLNNKILSIEKCAPTGTCLPQFCTP